ncbi:N-acetylmuramoyl-L-alanine amidase [Gracilibacillus timonensis]|uniref:N-acetylmuramoyl-L-alanine amidase n=1 Tax=Gracilibacillus timonensis TaxID=1816696 RepID=UPI000825CCD8|nr:N-acetylmuramoyl-L-alanine amidase [Gracilibacillus timonensis]
MKYNIIIGIAFCVCLFIFLPNVHANDGKMYEVNAEKVELRDAPAQEANVVAELQRGAKVTVFEDSYGWGETFYNGEKVWVAIHLLSEVNANQAADSDRETETTTSEEDRQLYHVQAPAVNVRNAPDTHATIITTLNKGDRVTIFQEKNGWGKTYYQNKEVWIALYLLDKETEKVDNEKPTEKEIAKASAKHKQVTTDQENSDKEQKHVEKAQEEIQTDPTKQASENTLEDYHIVIDPGHGGKDPGAIGSEVNEKTLTLSTANKLAKQLRDKGVSITLTRTNDTYIPLEERVSISNSAQKAIFISLHYNASTETAARGIETFYHDGVEDQKLAKSVQASLIDHAELQDRGTKQADFQVLKENKQPAILVELGFISHGEEQQLIQTDHYQEKAVAGIIAGLDTYVHG